MQCGFSALRIYELEINAQLEELIGYQSGLVVPQKVVSLFTSTSPLCCASVTSLVNSLWVKSLVATG
jgi:hypothetical protein